MLNHVDGRDGPVRALVTGATGYVGARLVPRLVQQGHEIWCLARGVERLRGRFDPRVALFEGDVRDAQALRAALDGVDVAYYLVHAMGDARDFSAAERDAAQTFATAAKAAGVRRIVYLGGLGDDEDELSKHLRSRHMVGEVLRAGGVQVVEFRAAQIIGSGSISFEMMRYLTDRLPVMIAPRWVLTRCQPIGIRDVLSYLIAAISAPVTGHRVYEIGGADVLTYKAMMLSYAALRGLRRIIIEVPFFSPNLSSYWVHLITPIPSRLARPLILGLRNEVVVRDGAAAIDFPHIHPAGIEEAIRDALDRNASMDPESTWFDAFRRGTLPVAFGGLREGMLIDRRVRRSGAPPAYVAAVFESLGGKRGWLAGEILWRMRGLIDLAFGGVGLRRGRRSASLRVGDAVDFWRVEAYEPARMLRLRAEMKLPGKAWLEFEVEPAESGSVFTQTAFFEPRGLFGYAYWYGISLFHEYVFAKLANRIVKVAEMTYAGDVRGTRT